MYMCQSGSNANGCIKLPRQLPNEFNDKSNTDLRV